MERTRHSDETLMTLVARGDREHLEPLIRRYASPLLTFIQKMVGDRHRSEDLFQEVFLAVWVHRSLYRTDRAFRPWLFTIALNKCRESFRRATLPIVQSSRGDLLDVQRDEGRTPVQLAVMQETARVVDRAVLGLPVKQRAVLVMRIWCGLPYAQIARALHRREATVRSQMFLALRALRPLLEPYVNRGDAEELLP